MPNENETPTRIEQYLAKAAGEDADLPSVPMTRIEQYLAKIAGEDVELPEETYTRIEQYLKHIAENGGGGGDITLETLNVSQNGTTNAPTGTAYNKVVASVPNTYAAADEGKVVSGGSLVAQTAHAQVTSNGTVDTTLNNSVEVAVPQPSGTKQISITQNGTTTENVADYASAEISVNVSGGGGGLELLADDTASSDVAAINVAIPSGKQNMRIYVVQLNGNLSASEWVYVTPNETASQTVSNYISQSNSFSNKKFIGAKGLFDGGSYCIPINAASPFNASRQVTTLTNIYFNLYAASSMFMSGFNIKVWGIDV